MWPYYKGYTAGNYILLTAVLYKFCHLVRIVRTTDPPFPSNWATGILKLILLTAAV